MIVVHWTVKARASTAADVQSVLAKLLVASRTVDGVVSFDIGRKIDDPDVFVATEVFEHRDALDAQESLPDVLEALRYLERDLEAQTEATIFTVTNQAPWGAN